MSDPTVKLCGNCRSELNFLKREHIQLGRHGFVFGDLAHLLTGAQDLEFWVCPNCRKLEFYVPEGAVEPEEADTMAQVACPVCGAQHDLDDPKCPRCGAKNTALY